MKKFKYLTDNNFAKSRYLKDAPCYRTVICAAFLEYHLFNSNESELQQKLDELINCFIEIKPFQLLSKDGFENNQNIFLEVYPIPMGNDTGFIIIDHTGGCFPLIINPRSHKKFNDKPNPSRCMGLNKVIQNIEKEKINLIELLHKYEYMASLNEEKQITEAYNNFQNELHSFIYSTRC